MVEDEIMNRTLSIGIVLLSVLVVVTSADAAKEDDRTQQVAPLDPPNSTVGHTRDENSNWEAPHTHTANVTLVVFDTRFLAASSNG